MICARRCNRPRSKTVIKSIYTSSSYHILSVFFFVYRVCFVFISACRFCSCANSKIIWIYALRSKWIIERHGIYYMYWYWWGISQNLYMTYMFRTWIEWWLCDDNIVQCVYGFLSGLFVLYYNYYATHLICLCCWWSSSVRTYTIIWFYWIKLNNH